MIAFDQSDGPTAPRQPGIKIAIELAADRRNADFDTEMNSKANIRGNTELNGSTLKAANALTLIPQRANLTGIVRDGGSACALRVGPRFWTRFQGGFTRFRKSMRAVKKHPGPCVGIRSVHCK